MTSIMYNKNPIETSVLSNLSNAYSFADEAKLYASKLVSPSGFIYANYIESLDDTIYSIKKNIKDTMNWVDDTIYNYDKAGSDIKSDIAKFTVNAITRETNSTNKLY